jgi:hypothetical protein
MNSFFFDKSGVNPLVFLKPWNKFYILRPVIIPYNNITPSVYLTPWNKFYILRPVIIPYNNTTNTMQGKVL